MRNLPANVQKGRSAETLAQEECRQMASGQHEVTAQPPVPSLQRSDAFQLLGAP